MSAEENLAFGIPYAPREERLESLRAVRVAPHRDAG